MRRIIGVLIACMILQLAAGIAHAQFRGAAPQLRRSDPYDSRRPTISPYLNLFNNQGTGVPQYQTQVRPFLEQRQINLQQSSAIQGLQAQQAAQARTTQIGNQALRPTGHRAGYLNFIRSDGRSAFYPGLVGR